MFVRAVVKEGTNDRAILVPQQAVSRDPKGNPLALTVDTEEKVQQRRLTIGRAIGDKWLVSFRSHLRRPSDRGGLTES